MNKSLAKIVNKELVAIGERKATLKRNYPLYKKDDVMDYRYQHKRYDSLLILNVVLGVILGGGSLFLIEVAAWRLYSNHYENVQKIIEAKVKNRSLLMSASMRNFELKATNMELERTKEIERIAIRNRNAANLKNVGLISKK